jgi:putative transcriptional regulator
MTQILESKRAATEFRILVEIAAGQPNIQQKDIAQRLNITPQAISEYIKKLIAEGLVTSDRRSRYRVTREGINWILKMSRELESYSTFVGKVVTSMSVCAAIADCHLSPGQRVGLYMKDGLLHASDILNGRARGTVTSEANSGEEIAVSDIEGMMKLEMGRVTICKVPNIQKGGSENADLVRLEEEAGKKTVIGAMGIEAIMALKRIGITPQYIYGVKEAAVEAAWRGLSPLIVCVEDDSSSLINRLEEESLDYELLDLRASPQQ